jgi:hypothetical protein
VAVACICPSHGPDAGLVISVYGASTFLVEAYLGVFALILLGFLIFAKKKSKGDETQ